METVICKTIKSIPKNQWEACRSSKGGGDPFLSYDFFSLLETSNSIGRNTGWAPFYIAFKEKNVVIEQEDLLIQLNEVQGISSVFFGPGFITITKVENSMWDTISQEIKNIFDRL